MKTFFYIILLSILSVIQSNAQDLTDSPQLDSIKMITGEVILGKVTEVSEKEIRYKRMDNLEGPFYIFKKIKIEMIVYANGTKEEFNIKKKPIGTINKIGNVITLTYMSFIAGIAIYFIITKR